jgi:hypothetical protein
MRISAVIAIITLVPATLSAQRIPLPGIVIRGPAHPAPLPPQAGPVAREMAYKRSHLSFETYPILSYIEAPAYTGIGALSAWTTVGMGSRAAYSFSRYASATFDVTSSFIGGPAYTQTAELGTRIEPPRSERRLYPFLDTRVGYISTYSRGLGAYDDLNIVPQPGYGGSRYSSGFGAIGGLGLECALTSAWSLTTSGSVARNRMTAHDFQGAQETNRNYDMTMLRYTLGLRYNRVNALPAPDTR